MYVGQDESNEEPLMRKTDAEKGRTGRRIAGRRRPRDTELTRNRGSQTRDRDGATRRNKIGQGGTRMRKAGGTKYRTDRAEGHREIENRDERKT